MRILSGYADTHLGMVLHLLIHSFIHLLSSIDAEF